MSLKSILKEIKSKEQEELRWRVCNDVLRALTILHGSAWHSELTATLYELWMLKELSEEERFKCDRLVEEAIRLLNDMGVMKSEERIKAELQGTPVKEVLHRASKFIDLLIVYGGDIEVIRYKREVLGWRPPT